MIEIELNSKGLRKIKERNPWIYNREIKRIKGEPKPGDIGYIVDKNVVIATGFVNTKSKITFRVLEFGQASDIENLISFRIVKAIEKRKTITNTNSKRLIHAEADGLPGLIVDQYGDNVVCSFDSAGINNLKSIVIEKIIEILKPKGVFKKDNPVREKEGLSISSEVIYGKVDDEFIVAENGRYFKTYLKSGQKTGFYLDQRKNRQIVSKFAGNRTLDLFSHSGGFGIYANAEYTKFVEVSKNFTKLIDENCKLNGMKNYDIVTKEAFKFLENEHDTYDLIIIDPPAFAKNKNALSGAIKGYKFLITKSLNILENDGYLAVFSCSNTVGFRELLEVSLKSSINVGCNLEVIEFLKQDIDHPFLLNIPSSLYLTGILFKKVK